MSDHGIFGGAADFLFGGIPPMAPDDQYEISNPLVLRPGETAYGFHYDWTPSIGRRSSVRGGYYATQASSSEAFAQALTSMGYEPPIWWQFWRWGERKLPADVAARVA